MALDVDVKRPVSFVETREVTMPVIVKEATYLVTVGENPQEALTAGQLGELFIEFTPDEVHILGRVGNQLERLYVTHFDGLAVDDSFRYMTADLLTEDGTRVDVLFWDTKR
jgi:hypothetical protein